CPGPSRAHRSGIGRQRARALSDENLARLERADFHLDAEDADLLLELVVVRVLGKSGQRARITGDADGGEPEVSTSQIREPVGALWREEDASPSVAAKLDDRDRRLERIAQLLHG